MHTPSILRRNETGMVLVLTLVLLAIATMLVVAFAMIMRIENASSVNYRYSLQARQSAEAGVADALTWLRVATTNISATSYYVTAPGRIYTTAFPPQMATNLYSSAASVAQRNNMNLYSEISPRAGAINAGWLYIQDPVTTRLIGRYCYWVDDEASKINVNAGTNSVSSAGLAMFGVNAAPLLNYLQNSGPLPTPRSLPVSGAVSVGNCTNNIFDLTSYTTDVKLTPWGTPCPSLNALVASATSVAAKRTAAQTIAACLRDTRMNPWFGNQNFSVKYGNNCLQIGANIVDYIDTDNSPTDNGTTPPTYLGLERTPYLNELAVSNSFRVATNQFGMVVQMNSTTYVELWYMYPSPAYDLSGHTVTLQNRPSITFSGGFPAKTYLPNPVTLNASGIMPGQAWAGSYSLLTRVETMYAATANVASTTVTFNRGSVTAVFQGPGGRLDYATIPRTNHTLVLNRGMAASGRNNFGSWTNVVWDTSCKDPRVRPVSNYWNPVGGGTLFRSGTLGEFNNGTVFYTVTNTAPGCAIRLVSDAILSGTSPDFSCHTNIANSGAMASLGELGFIHTGVPWRTLRLGHPGAFEELPLASPVPPPDWAILDLFSTTNLPVTGRININARVADVTGWPVANNERVRSLSALLAGTPISGAGGNIRDRNYAILGYKLPWPTSVFPTNCYAMIGQVCEISGVVTNIGGTNTKVNREAGIRAIADRITTRSDTFTIWSRGQRVIGTYPNTVTAVLGDAYLQSVVQRATNGTWKVIYQRWVTP